MAISKNLALCGVALSLLSASGMPASADVCGDFHANVAKLSEDLNQQKAEMARVSSIQPPPPTDAGLCEALQKVHDDAEAFWSVSRYAGISLVQRRREDCVS